MTNENVIKVFGSNAEKITEGQTFVATVGSVEGRKVVTLHPVSVDEIDYTIPTGFDQRGAKKY